MVTGVAGGEQRCGGRSQVHGVGTLQSESERGKGVQEDGQLTRSATEGSARPEEVGCDGIDGEQRRGWRSRFCRLGASRQVGVGKMVTGEEAELLGYSSGLRVTSNGEAGRRPDLGFGRDAGERQEEGEGEVSG
jgi:hypothetical protein